MDKKRELYEELFNSIEEIVYKRLCNTPQLKFSELQANACTSIKRNTIPSSENLNQIKDESTKLFILDALKQKKYHDIVKKLNILISLHVEDLRFDKNYSTNFLAFLEGFKREFKEDLKIIYLNNTHLLQDFIGEMVKVENNYKINVPVVKYISYAKHYLQEDIIHKILIKKANIPYTIVTDLFYDVTGSSSHKLKTFLKVNKEINPQIKTLNHNTIQNWNELFNGLSGTALAQYLK